MDDERIEQLANSLSESTKAYERGVRIVDSMTFEQAHWINFGRKMHEALKGGKPIDPQVIDSSHRFRGDKK